VWYRGDDQGNLRDILLIEIPKIEQSWVSNKNDEIILLHIKDLTDTPPLPNLTFEEEEVHSTDSCDEMT
jgi:hypothetical protein